MKANDPKSRVLCAVFSLRQEDAPVDLISIAEEAGINLYRTLRELSELGELQLICPRRLTLRAAGLSLAVALQGVSEATNTCESRAAHPRLRGRGRGVHTDRSAA